MLRDESQTGRGGTAKVEASGGAPDLPQEKYRALSKRAEAVVVGGGFGHVRAGVGVRIA